MSFPFLSPLTDPTHPNPTQQSTPAYTYNYELMGYIAKHGLQNGDPPTLAIAAVTFFTLYGLKVIKRDFLPPTPARLKSPLYRLFGQFVTFSTVIVVVATSLWARALHLANPSAPGVAVVGDIPVGWNPLRRVALGEFGAMDSFLAAVPLALIGFLETYSMARKFALVHKYDIDINQEASAIGIANLLSCVFRCVRACVRTRVPMGRDGHPAFLDTPPSPAQPDPTSADPSPHTHTQTHNTQRLAVDGELRADGAGQRRGRADADGQPGGGPLHHPGPHEPHPAPLLHPQGDVK